MSTILDFWNMSNEQINDILRDKHPKTKSSNLKIQLLSSLDVNLLCEFENKLLSDGLLIEILEQLDGKFPDNIILLKAVQEYTCLKRIKDLRNNIHDYINRSIVVEESLKDEKNEMETCPLNVDDNSSYYGINTKTGKEELLSAKHIFLEKGHCYDENSIYKYLSLGGCIFLYESYIRRYFNNFGYSNHTNQGLSNESTRDLHIDNTTRTILLNDNYITSTSSLKLPESCIILSLDGNPLYNNIFLNEYNHLKLLSLRGCSINYLNCNYLPSSITELDLSNNIILDSIHNISKLTSLHHLLLNNTNIKFLDCSKFKKIGENKLTIHCDRSLEIKNKPEWIIIKH